MVDGNEHPSDLSSNGGQSALRRNSCDFRLSRSVTIMAVEGHTKLGKASRRAKQSIKLK